MKNNLMIISPNDAFNRGNLFNNLFLPYKYVANLTPKNDKEELLLKNQIYCFAAHELNLYLDIYPNDIQAIGLYNQYKEEAINTQKKYEEKYGPIELGINESYNWEWINSPWPWERI